MTKSISNIAFKLMAFGFSFRDLLLPRRDVLNEVGIKPGFHILDYGCGPGSYSIIAAEMVGVAGKVYALDIYPLAVRQLETCNSKKRLANIETIHSDCATGLPDDSIDIVLLCDVFHALSDRNEVLEELHRVLKPDGILSFSDHHMKEGEILSRVTDRGLFRLSAKGERTYSFLKGQSP